MWGSSLQVIIVTVNINKIIFGTKKLIKKMQQPKNQLKIINNKIKHKMKARIKTKYAV